MIRDDRDFETHMGYIFWNPVKHGYVEKPEDWSYTSMHRDNAAVPLASLAAPLYCGFVLVSCLTGGVWMHPWSFEGPFRSEWPACQFEFALNS